jgi:DNA-dependent metalloprotease WSS1
MNHSRAFWAVRNQYAEQMRTLWARDYTGDGVWGRGALLGSGAWEKNLALPSDVLPEHLCGGTYRSRRRKRRAKPTISYQERKERRILKKFGANGVTLGADDEAKVKLEKGKRTAAKPRVAGSARGRELRAAAALARYSQQKKQDAKEEATDDEKIKFEEGDGSETESDYEDAEREVSDAVDLDGRRLLDSSGHGMVKVCEDEDPDDDAVKNEQQELRLSMKSIPMFPGTKKTVEKPPQPDIKESGSSIKKKIGEPSQQKIQNKSKVKVENNNSRRDENRNAINPSDSSQAAICTICSFQNPPLSIVCGMCSHVLDPQSVPNSWKCKGNLCNKSKYTNPGDFGVCGLCGRPRNLQTVGN